MAQWQNDDGLTVYFGNEGEGPSQPTVKETVTAGGVHQMVIEFTYDNLPDFTTDLDNDGTNDGWTGRDASIPANAYITRATLIATTDWATADAATLTIGLYEEDGTVIDADGIDATIAAAALDTGDVVLCDGALVGGTVTIGSAAAFVKATVANTWTTGAAKLVIEYIPS